MALAQFLAAVRAAASSYAPDLGLDPQELEIALLTAAGLEGGLGENAAVGDNGASVGRFQFNTNGGHGATLINQGYTREQISDDQFQAMHWAPILGAELARVKKLGGSGAAAVKQAIYNVERPAEMYPDNRFQTSYAQAGGTGSGGILGGAGMPTSDSAAKYWENRREYNKLNAQYGIFFENPDLAARLGMKAEPAALQAAYQRLTEIGGELTDYEDALEASGGVTGDDVMRAYDFYNKTDPLATEAENSANRYAREYQQRSLATQVASDELTNQLDTYKAAVDSQSIDRSTTPTPGAFLATPAKIESGANLFAKALENIKKGLPEVTDMPSPLRPAGGPDDWARMGQPPTPTPTLPKVPITLPLEGHTGDADMGIGMGAPRTPTSSALASLPMGAQTGDADRGIWSGSGRNVDPGMAYGADMTGIDPGIFRSRERGAAGDPETDNPIANGVRRAVRAGGSKIRGSIFGRF